MWFLTGLPGERIGLFMRLHHAIADGVSGIAALGAFFDVDPQAQEVNVPPWVPTPMPSTRGCSRTTSCVTLEESAACSARWLEPRDTVGKARRGWPAVREAFAEARALGQA